MKLDEANEACDALRRRRDVRFRAVSIMTEDIVFIMPCPDESFRVEVCEQDSPRRQAQLLAFRLL